MARSIFNLTALSTLCTCQTRRPRSLVPIVVSVRVATNAVVREIRAPEIAIANVTREKVVKSIGAQSAVACDTVVRSITIDLRIGIGRDREIGHRVSAQGREIGELFRWAVAVRPNSITTSQPCPVRCHLRNIIEAVDIELLSIFVLVFI